MSNSLATPQSGSRRAAGRPQSAGEALAAAVGRPRQGALGPAQHRPRGSNRGAEREALFMSHLPLARKLARRYRQTSVPLQDLEQVASIGLLLAADRFDPERGRPFGSFAIPTILGELRRHLRDHSRTIHVTRGAQERAARVRAVRDQITVEKGRPPTVPQLAQHLEVDQEDVIDGLLALAAGEARSLDQPAIIDAEEGDLLDRIGTEDPNYELAEARVTLAGSLHALDTREREILEMRFGEELTQSAIAERLGCSQMQISRVQARALRKLRDHATQDPDA